MSGSSRLLFRIQKGVCYKSPTNGSHALPVQRQICKIWSRTIAHRYCLVRSGQFYIRIERSETFPNVRQTVRILNAFGKRKCLNVRNVRNGTKINAMKTRVMYLRANITLIIKPIDKLLMLHYGNGVCKGRTLHHSIFISR